jgi:hypothetical protein
MRPLRAFFATAAIYSLLLWAYTTARFLAYSIPPTDPFIYDIGVSFWQLAVCAFVLSGLSFFGYLITTDDSNRPKSPWSAATRRY